MKNFINNFYLILDVTSNEITFACNGYNFKAQFGKGHKINSSASWGHSIEVDKTGICYWNLRDSDNSDCDNSTLH